MKKLYKNCLLLSVFALASCGEGQTQMQIYRQAFDDGKNVEVIKESLDSEKDIYYTLAFVFADEEKDFVIDAKDIKANVNGSDYQCLYFIESYNFSSIKVNGNIETFAYIVSKESVTTAEHGNVATNLLCAFDNDLTENFSLYYQGNIIKKFGE